MRLNYTSRLHHIIHVISSRDNIFRSTYPIEVQYHEKPISLDSTGKITNTQVLNNSTRYNFNSTASKSSTAFEIPNSPKSRFVRLAVRIALTYFVV